MSDFDFNCECGLHEDPICKCNGGPGYDEVVESHGTAGPSQNVSRPATASETAARIIMILVLVAAGCIIEAMGGGFLVLIGVIAYFYLRMICS